VPKGARLIDVCREKGFDIPSFCYYSDLALQASCRMCLVRIEKMPKLQTSCTIIVHRRHDRDDARVKRSRRRSVA
jgi:NADH-quinone oxidoreductase subunit G